MSGTYPRHTRGEFADQEQTGMGRGRLGNCVFKRHSPADSSDEPCIEYIEQIDFLTLSYFNP